MLLCEIALVELLPDDKVIAQIKKYKRLFLRFTHENQKAQKYLMGGIEKTIETKKDDLLPKVRNGQDFWPLSGKWGWADNMGLLKSSDAKNLNSLNGVHCPSPKLGPSALCREWRA